MGPDPLLEALLTWLRDADADIARQLPAFADIAPAAPGDLTDDRPMTRTEAGLALGRHPDTVSRYLRNGQLRRAGRGVSRESVRAFQRGATSG
jgi:hypothetical protein